MGQISIRAAGLQILSPAHGAKLEAITAHWLGNESKLLAMFVLDLAVNFPGKG